MERTQVFCYLSAATGPITSEHDSKTPWRVAPIVHLYEIKKCQRAEYEIV